LVRWHHPTRGVVHPAEFIPAAERTGLIVPLGRFVLCQMCRQAAAWSSEFGADALQEAALNVSARQLHDPDFVPDVTAALTDSGLPCERLVLEVTESAVLRGQQVSRTLYELDRMGIRLSLDAAADARQAVARAVIQLAQALGLETAAEGVESAEQAAVLREVGYTLGHGHHLAQPMTAESVSRLLARQQTMVVAER
jgi:diguanylate cyclase